MRRTQSAVRRFIRTSRLSRFAQESPQVRELALAYVAGEDVDDAIDVAEDLSSKGLSLAFTYLGRADGGAATSGHLAELLKALNLDDPVELSVRPSALGLRESADRTRGVLSDLLDEAREHGATVTLEMEGHQYYAETLALFRAARAGHEAALGLTLPVDIRRAERDTRDLGTEAARVRLCVGSYPAPGQVAYRSEHEKSLALVRCMRILFESAAHPLVASHDPRIIGIAQELATRNNRAPEEFEFQMMMGVRPLEQRRLVDIGFTCRTYVPFGPDWYGYLATRIAARPRTLWSYARAILDKR